MGLTSNKKILDKKIDSEKGNEFRQLYFPTEPEIKKLIDETGTIPMFGEEDGLIDEHKPSEPVEYFKGYFYLRYLPEPGCYIVMNTPMPLPLSFVLKHGLREPMTRLLTPTPEQRDKITPEDVSYYMTNFYSQYDEFFSILSEDDE